jgi:hypothetical protein
VSGGYQMLKQSANRYAAVLVLSLLLTFFLVFIIPFYLFDAYHKFGFFYVVFSAITAPVVARGVFIYCSAKFNSGS